MSDDVRRLQDEIRKLKSELDEEHRKHKELKDRFERAKRIIDDVKSKITTYY